MIFNYTNLDQWTYRYGECGGDFTTPNGRFTSPSYPNPYPQFENCIYLISQPKGVYINISFISMDIICHIDDGVIVGDFIEIRDGNSEDSALMGIFCGNISDVPAFMQTTQNFLRIR